MVHSRHLRPSPHLSLSQILEGLHAVSEKLLEEWRSAELAPLLPAGSSAAALSFIRGDATAVDWSDADFLFANSTCYNEPLMTAIASTAERMKPGSFAVTFTKRLPSAAWQLLDSQTYSMSWGCATVCIHRKVLPVAPAAFVGTALAKPATAAEVWAGGNSSSSSSSSSAASAAGSGSSSSSSSGSSLHFMGDGYTSAAAALSFAARPR